MFLGSGRALVSWQQPEKRTRDPTTLSRPSRSPEVDLVLLPQDTFVMRARSTARGIATWGEAVMSPLPHRPGRPSCPGGETRKGLPPTSPGCWWAGFRMIQGLGRVSFSRSYAA